jgi:hypothetical protein
VGLGQLLEFGRDRGRIEDLDIPHALIVRNQHGVIGIAEPWRRVTGSRAGGARRRHRNVLCGAVKMQEISIFLLQCDKYFLIDASASGF